MTTKRAIRIAPCLLVLVVCATPLPGTSAGGVKVGQTLEFAAEMARRGNWREARYRWEQVAREQPDNPRVLNNLAVASEVIGDNELARTYYRQALELSGSDPRILENARRFERLLRMTGAAPGADGEPEPALLATDRAGRGSTAGGKRVLWVAARFSLPARLDLSNYKTILVASFLTEETELLDTNRELARFLRGEFHKRSELQVRDVSPPPAIPEQTVQDLLANDEFWKHLGREYDADLIVSGVVKFTREDFSGFQDVDRLSPVTGQKVRETKFVEQEQFTYDLDLFFMDGATGALVFRDRLQRSAVYPGGSNDSLTAFYGLADSLAADVLAVVSPRIREDVRLVFSS